MANEKFSASDLSEEAKKSLDDQIGYNSDTAFDDDDKLIEDFIAAGAEDYTEAVLLAEEERQWEDEHSGDETESLGM